MNELDVTLTWPELRNAAHVGIDRHVRALASGRAPQYGIGHDDWAAHVLGAWGECVVAKTTGCYWVGDLGQPDRGAPDVGKLHVRTRSEPWQELILRLRCSPIGDNRRGTQRGDRSNRRSREPPMERVTMAHDRYPAPTGPARRSTRRPRTRRTPTPDRAGRGRGRGRGHRATPVLTVEP